MRAPSSRTVIVRWALTASAAAAVAALACVTPVAAQSPSGRQEAVSQPVSATAPLGSAADIQDLRERAAAFWAARVSGDFEKQWGLLEPRGRARETAAEYAPTSVVKYLAYRIDNATVTGYFAKVHVHLIVQAMLPTASQQKILPSAVSLDDIWVRIRGTWYRALEQGEAGRPPMPGS